MPHKLTLLNQESFKIDDIKRRMLFKYLEFFKKNPQEENLDHFEKVIFVIKGVKAKDDVLFSFKEEFDFELIDLFTPFLSGYFFLAEDYEEYFRLSEELENFLGTADEVYNLLEDKTELNTEEQSELLILIKNFIEKFPPQIEDFERMFWF